MTITRTLRCAAILSFLALPVIFYLGRPTLADCPAPAHCLLGPPQPASWLDPVFYSVSGIAVVLLVLGAMVSRHRGEVWP
jgi:hypothetical protein